MEIKISIFFISITLKQLWFRVSESNVHTSAEQLLLEVAH